MPTPLTSDLTLMLTRELDGIAREIEAFPDDTTIWQVAPGVTNSAGNLALHIAGNMLHFIGTLLGNTGYVRDRDREFSQRSGTKRELLEELARARAVVQRVLPSVPPESLETTLTTHSMPGPVRAQRLLLHMCAHAGFHLGQIGYLRRIVTGENRSAGPLPVTALFD